VREEVGCTRRDDDGGGRPSAFFLARGDLNPTERGSYVKNQQNIQDDYAASVWRRSAGQMDGLPRGGTLHCMCHAIKLTTEAFREENLNFPEPGSPQVLIGLSKETQTRVTRRQH
jgi:hypothetical protein